MDDIQQIGDRDKGRGRTKEEDSQLNEEDKQGERRRNIIRRMCDRERGKKGKEQERTNRERDRETEE